MRWHLAIVITVIGLCGCDSSKGPPASAPQKPVPVGVQSSRVSRGTIRRAISIPATVQPFQQATLYAKVPGYLKQIRVDVGDIVKKEQVLAEIEAPELAADLARFQADVVVAQRDLKRLVEAREKAPDLVVAQVLDAAQNRFDTAKATLDRTQTLLGYTHILAPFTGKVTRRFVDPGAFIPAATSSASPQTAALVTLMDYSRVRVQGAAPEGETPRIIPGTPAAILVDALPGKKWDGTVTRISGALDEATRTMMTEVELANEGGALRPGMYAALQLFVERHDNALVLPVAAVVVEKIGPSVFRNVNGMAKKSPVKTGFNDGTNIEILDGVTEGESVIRAAGLGLADGQPVQAGGNP